MMYGRNTELLFKLLRLSTGAQEAYFPKLGPDEWNLLYNMAIQQSVLGPVFTGIEKLPNEYWPDKMTSMKFYAQVKYVRSFHQQVAEASISAIRHLQRDGHRCVILKGISSAYYYPVPESRSSGDVDIWVEGSRKWIIGLCREINPLSKVYYHHIPLVKVNGVELEVHITPTWMCNPFADARLQRWFRDFWKDGKHLASIPYADTQLPVLDDAYARVFLLIHIFRHIFTDGVGLRHLMDYYCLLRKGTPEEEKRQVMAFLRQLNLAGFAAAVMYVLREVFNLPRECMLTAPDTRRGAFLLKEVLRAGNFGQYDDRLKGENGGSPARNFFARTLRSLRFLTHYPSETLWLPFFKIWHFMYRKYYKSV